MNSRCAKRSFLVCATVLPTFYCGRFFFILAVCWGQSEENLTLWRKMDAIQNKTAHHLHVALLETTSARLRSVRCSMECSRSSFISAAIRLYSTQIYGTLLLWAFNEFQFAPLGFFLFESNSGKILPSLSSPLLSLLSLKPWSYVHQSSFPNLKELQITMDVIRQYPSSEYSK